MSTQPSTETTSLPKTYRALLFTSASEAPTVTSLPTPPLTASTALVRPIHTALQTYVRDIFTKGNPRGFPYPLPIVPGSSTVGRLLAAAPDAPLLDAHTTPSSADALVLIDPFIRGSDGSAPIILGLTSGPTPQGAASMASEWRHGTLAEVVRVPAANVHLLDEARLLGPPSAGGLGYTMTDLGFISTLAVGYGGLRTIGVSAGDVVIVAPATGAFGGAAAMVALALGASVVAAGRNAGALATLESVAARAYPGRRLRTVRLAGTDVASDRAALVGAAAEIGGKMGPDVFFDISPPGAAGSSSHVRAGILALRPGGRAVLMGGGPGEDVAVPYADLMLMGLTVRGNFMYTREQVAELVRLIEAGVIKLGEEVGLKCTGVFELEEWEEAFKTAGDEGGMGKFTLMTPNKARF